MRAKSNGRLAGLFQPFSRNWRDETPDARSNVFSDGRTLVSQNRIRLEGACMVPVLHINSLRINLRLNIGVEYPKEEQSDKVTSL